MQLFIDELGPDDAFATLALDNEPPTVTLRVNPTRTTTDEVVAELRAAGIEVEPGDARARTRSSFAIPAISVRSRR